MYNVKTLDDSEAVSNETEGYMQRRELSNAFVCIVGDYIKYWSTNTLDTGYTKTN